MRLPRWLMWRSNAELDEEIRAHLDLEIGANLARGMSPDEARRAGLRKFGNVAFAKERAREADPMAWVEHLVRETRQAWRRLSQSPGFTGTAVLTLALGIGSTASIFSIAEPLLTRPLPVRAPDELILLETVNPVSVEASGIPEELFHRLTQESATLSGLVGSGVSDSEWILELESGVVAPDADSDRRRIMGRRGIIC